MEAVRKLDPTFQDTKKVPALTEPVQSPDLLWLAESTLENVAKRELSGWLSSSDVTCSVQVAVQPVLVVWL